MKYGKILDENIIHQHKSFYINYKYLKQNIFCKKDKFISLLKLEINKVETFFLEKREDMHNIDNFCLLNLFSILKITKKYHKKNNQDISDIVYNLYFRKSFYLYLVSDLNINQGGLLRGFQKCSLCYDRTIYILQNRENISQELFCKRCSASTNKIQEQNSIVIALEQLTKNTFNPFYLPLIKYPKRCLFVGIDGLRPDCLLFANTPNIDKVLKGGVYNFDTKITTDSYSAPSWGAILSGYSQEKLGINSNECVENKMFRWKTTNLFQILKNKNVSTLSVTSSWKGMKNLVQDSTIKYHHHDNTNVAENDNSATEQALTLLHEMGNNSFLFLYLNSVDHTGHKYGFTLQSNEYIQSIEKVDKYLEHLINTCFKEHISLIFTTDHGGSKKTDLCSQNMEEFLEHKSLQPQMVYNGIHGLDCQQHKRVFQIYYGNIVNFCRKEDINIESNLNIYQKIIDYFE